MPEEITADLIKNWIKNNSKNEELIQCSQDFMNESIKAKYSYNFSWMGRPIIQYPQDMIAMQEIIWNVQPDVIIETGIAHGGSLIYNASILSLTGKGSVIGIDIDIREHNRKAIEAHPMVNRITMIEGSSIATETLDKVKQLVNKEQTILVSLDSNHTHEHVLRELELYSEFVTKGSYLIVFDTIVQDTPDEFWNDCSWGLNDNPKTAVHEFLKNHNEFVIDKDIENKLLISVAPNCSNSCISFAT